MTSHGMGGAVSRKIEDYSQLNTIPAGLSAIYLVASVYLFGGITEFTLVWADYTLTTQHALIASLGAFAIAFMSSETRAFERYARWEQGLIAAGPGVMLGYQYSETFATELAAYGETGMIAATALGVVSWGVAVR